MAVYCSISGVRISETAIGGLFVPHPIFQASLETFGKAIDRWEDLNEYDKRLLFSGILSKNPLIRLQSTKDLPIQFVEAFIYQVFDFTNWIVRRDKSLIATFPVFNFTAQNAASFQNVFAGWVASKLEWEENVAKSKAKHASRLAKLETELQFDEDQLECDSLAHKFGTFLLTEHWEDQRTFSGRYASIFLAMLSSIDGDYADRESGAFKAAHKVLTTPFASLERSKGWNIDTVNHLLNLIDPMFSQDSKVEEFDPELLDTIPHNMRVAAKEVLYALRVHLTGSANSETLELVFEDDDTPDLDFSSAPKQVNKLSLPTAQTAAINQAFTNTLIANMLKSAKR